MRSVCLKCLFFAVLALFLMSGCAATGGGSAAQFTPKNSQEIVLSPYYLSDPSEGGDHAWYMKLKISDKRPVAGFLKPNQMLMETYTRWISSLTPTPGRLLQAETAQAAGSGCLGAYSAWIGMAPDGSFTGELSYEKFSDDCSLVFDGVVPLTGRLDLVSGRMSTEMSLMKLKMSLEDQPLQLQGGVHLEFSLYGREVQVFTALSNLSLTDASGPRYRLRDMQFVWDRRGEYPRETLQGWIDFAGQGSVRLTTESPLQLDKKRGLPFDGVLLFHGAQDSWLRLWFAKPAFPGFIKIHGSDGLETRGQL